MWNALQAYPPALVGAPDLSSLLNKVPAAVHPRLCYRMPHVVLLTTVHTCIYINSIGAAMLTDMAASMGK